MNVFHRLGELQAEVYSGFQYCLQRERILRSTFSTQNLILAHSLVMYKHSPIINLLWMPIQSGRQKEQRWVVISVVLKCDTFVGSRKAAYQRSMKNKVCIAFIHRHYAPKTLLNSKV